MTYFMLAAYTIITALLDTPFSKLLSETDIDAQKAENFANAIYLSWLLKPVYGFFGDWLFIFGYRVKSYVAIFALGNVVIAFVSVKVVWNIKNGDDVLWLMPMLLMLYFNLGFIDAICRNKNINCRGYDFDNVPPTQKTS